MFRLYHDIFPLSRRFLGWLQIWDKCTILYSLDEAEVSLLATINDVARRAGVSIGTVSKYINGIKIREQNRVKVAEAVEALDYHINPYARALKTNQTRVVTVLLPNIAGIYYPLIIREIERILYTRDYMVLLMDTDSQFHLEQQKIRTLMEQLVDGFIVFPIDSRCENYQVILERRIPLCAVDMPLPGLSCTQVLSDNVSAARDATQTLLGEGHRRIALITGDPDNTIAVERLNGFQMACREAGVEIPPEYILARGFREADGYEGARQILSLPQRPTALVACNYHTTLGAFQAIQDAGLSLSRDMRLVGFDYEALPKITRQPIGIVAQNIPEIAAATVRALLKQIRDPNLIGQAETIRIPTRYIPSPYSGAGRP